MTLRAVALASGVSHNAPYKHFAGRDALLAAVAQRDFEDLRVACNALRASKQDPVRKLMKAMRVMVDFSQEHPARYRLLFANRMIASADGELKAAAGGAFAEFRGLVEECQCAGKLPAVPAATLTSLLFATLHGLISMETIGGLHPEKGLRSIEGSLKVLVELIVPAKSPGSA